MTFTDEHLEMTTATRPQYGERDRLLLIVTAERGCNVRSVYFDKFPPCHGDKQFLVATSCPTIAQDVILPTAQQEFPDRDWKITVISEVEALTLLAAIPASLPICGYAMISAEGDLAFHFVRPWYTKLISHEYGQRHRATRAKR
jgi:hypothetical protein